MKIKNYISVFVLLIYAVFAGGSIIESLAYLFVLLLYSLAAGVCIAIILAIAIGLYTHFYLDPKEKKEAEDLKKRKDRELKYVKSLFTSNPDVIIEMGNDYVRFFLASDQERAIVVNRNYYKYEEIEKFKIICDSVEIYEIQRNARSQEIIKLENVFPKRCTYEKFKYQLEINKKDKVFTECFDPVIYEEAKRIAHIIDNIVYGKESCIVTEDSNMTFYTNYGNENVNFKIIESLSKLSDLKEKGILTDEEFQQQKQKLLNQRTGVK